jgi:pimeloyl-ACP methyl ester carboxylesterase
MTLSDGASADIGRTGSGPPLIIQHGWTGSPLDWIGVVRQLQSHFSCFCWDMRPYFSDEVSVERMAGDIAEVIRGLSIQRPILLGHSMGALVSWEYIQHHGCDELRALVIVDQSPKVITDAGWSLGLFGNFTSHDNAVMLQRLEDDFIRAVLDLVSSGKVLTRQEKQALLLDETMILRLERLKTIDPRPWIDAWRSFVIRDYRSVLREITVPTLLVYGGKSNFYGSEVARYVARNIPDATLDLYPNAGHSPHLEQPERFVEELVRFSRNVD